VRQLALFDELTSDTRSLRHNGFSHDKVAADSARADLEARYGHLLQETDEFSRRLVSFQANKTETLHGWIKYREGFSATLIEILLGKFGLQPGDAVLDPFAGSCTTLLVAQSLGLDATGIELLPNSHLAWEAKSKAYQYDLAEVDHVRALIHRENPPRSDRPFPHLTITESAFPDTTEQELMDYSVWMEALPVSPNTRLLLRLALMSLLESVSYTRKDGQYLRWDSRASKMVEANGKRLARQQRTIEGIDKGELPGVKSELLRVLDTMRRDIAVIQRGNSPTGRQELIEGSALYVLPTLAPGQFDAVITSPPYANRYDYTRTYALELAYLGVGDDIFRLRQALLSCTVENRPKLDEIGSFYQSIGESTRFAAVRSVVESNAALAEVNQALAIRDARGEINNSGVLGMIQQYFTELTFIYAELLRACKPGAHVAFVNDNVRYAGEIIPVDLLCTDLAIQLGFRPEVIYVLPQRKGNSSQQMGRYGRVELRKSITIWRKP